MYVINLLSWYLACLYWSTLKGNTGVNKEVGGYNKMNRDSNSNAKFPSGEVSGVWDVLL